MIRGKIFRTAAFRLAIAYAALFAFSVSVLFAVVYIVLEDYSSGQIRSAVAADAATLIDEVRTDGLNRVASIIDARVEADRDEAHYVLVSADGRRLAGDLPADVASEGWRTFDDPIADRDDEGERLIALGSPLSDGALLVVAHQMDERDELLSVLILAFSIAGLLSIALALGAGLILSRAFLGRIDHFNRTASQIMQGRLDERVPLTGSGDEFDRLAENVNAMLSRIQHLMESMRQVSSDVAHDLRTPLSRLRQGLELANRKATNLDEFRHAVDRALSETDDILATFTALLRIAQIEAGSRKAGFTTVDLSGAFQAIEEAYAAVIEDSGRRLRTSIEPGVTFPGDRELIIQLLSNLLDNAIHHTPPQSLITMTLRRQAGGVVGSVADNGEGVPESERAKVLTRFYRLEHSRTTNGNGLGLALVSAIAELHGIELQLYDNKPGLAVRMSFPKGNV